GFLWCSSARIARPYSTNIARRIARVFASDASLGFCVRDPELRRLRLVDDVGRLGVAMQVVLRERAERGHVQLRDAHELPVGRATRVRDGSPAVAAEKEHDRTRSKSPQRRSPSPQSSGPSPPNSWFAPPASLITLSGLTQKIRLRYEPCRCISIPS